MMVLNNLPTIIDSVGTYVTRGGNTVYIDKITQGHAPDTTAFAAKGTLCYTKRGNVRVTRKYGIWHVSGRVSIFSDNHFDIVAKLCYYY